MKRCPVCETQLEEIIPEFCEICGWDVGEDLTLQPILNMPDEEDIARYKKRVENARKIWGKRQEERVSFEKKLQEVKKEEMQNIPILEQEPISQENLNDNMVFVEGGTFTMGDTSSVQSTHEVTLDSFYIGKYPVTQKEYREVMGYNPSRNRGDNNPVELVTWFDAIAYANKLSEQEGFTPYYNLSDLTKYLFRKKIRNAFVTILGGNGYRLPLDIEWEFAARGGIKSKGYKYSGSNNIDEVAYYYGNSSSRTHSVGEKKANELGIFDMSGNVSEWCWDLYSTEYSEKGRMVRGGSYVLYEPIMSIYDKCGLNPSDDYGVVGFRLVRSY